MDTLFSRISKPAFGYRPHFRWFVVTLPLFLMFIFIATQSHGNGWEHGAIPFEALVKALEFESPGMRMRAAQSLGIRGQPEAVEPLLRRFDKPEENPLVRSALYVALGNLKDPRGIPVLTACLDGETREELRSDCVTALGVLGDESTLPHLLTARREESSFLVKSRVVGALGGFSEEAAVQTLAALVTGDGNRNLRQRAIRALGGTESQAAVKPLLKALAGSRSDNERLLIVRALTKLRSSKATKPLTKLLHNTEDPQLRTQIVIALGTIRDGDTYPILIEMLTDEVPAVRYFAVKSLRNQGRREAAIPIGRLSLKISRRLEQHSTQELLADPVAVLADLSFQVAALQAITELDASKGLQALLHAARPRSVPRDSAAALKLAKNFYRQRRAALNGLGYSRSREAAAFLAGRQGIGDPDFRLRAVAVRSLGVLGFSDTSEKVIFSLDDPVAEVRWTAALVLGRLGVLNAVKPLMKRLSDINSEVRKQSALSLGYLADRRAYDELSRLATDDENKNVRIAAAYSLQLLGK